MLNYLKTKDSNERTTPCSNKTEESNSQLLPDSLPENLANADWIVSRKWMKAKDQFLICLAQKMMDRRHIIGMQKTKKMKRLQSKILLFMPNVMMK